MPKVKNGGGKNNGLIPLHQKPLTLVNIYHHVQNPQTLRQNRAVREEKPFEQDLFSISVGKYRPSPSCFQFISGPLSYFLLDRTSLAVLRFLRDR